jgi:hypothetical protein
MLILLNDINAENDIRMAVVCVYFNFSSNKVD